MKAVAKGTLNSLPTILSVIPLASQRVSNITRCYGFSGQNSGKYLQYKLTLKDIEGFVKNIRMVATIVLLWMRMLKRFMRVDRKYKHQIQE